MQKVRVFNFSVRECVWGCELYAFEDDWLTGFWSLPTQNQLSLGTLVVSRVARVDRMLDAAFVELGQDQQGFLKNHHIKCVFSQSLGWQAFDQKRSHANSVPINEKVKVGDLILVQITKLPRGQKGYQVSADIKFEGLFWVYRAHQSCHVSKQGLSTSALDDDALERAKALEIQVLERRWQAIKHQSMNRAQVAVLWREHPAASLLIQRLNEVRLEIGHRLRLDLCKSLTTDFGVLAHLQEVEMNEVAEHNTNSFALGSPVDQQIQAGLATQIPLADLGATLVIQQHEAMASIDVNSGGAHVSVGSNTSTKLMVNQAALAPIVHQIRLRNLTGLIIIDWISISRAQWRDWAPQIQRALAADAAVRSVENIPAKCLTLIERSATGATLRDAMTQACQRCDGTGRQVTARTYAHRLLDALASLVHQATNHSGCYLVQLHEDVKQVLDEEYAALLVQFVSDHGMQLTWNLHANQLSDYNIGRRALGIQNP